MARSEVTSKAVVAEGNEVVITKTVEETMTLNDLMSKKEDIRRQRELTVSQSRDLKRRFDDLVLQEQEIDEMIALLPKEEPVEL